MTIKDIHTLFTEKFVVSFIRCGSYLRLFAGNLERNKIYNIDANPPGWMRELIDHGGRWFEYRGDLVLESVREKKRVRLNFTDGHLHLVVSPVTKDDDLGIEGYNELIWRVRHFTSLDAVKDILSLDED